MAVFDIDKIIDEELKFKDKISLLNKTVENNTKEIESIKAEIKKFNKKSNKNNFDFFIETDRNDSTVTKRDFEIKKIDVDYYFELLLMSDNLSDLEEFMPNINDDECEDIINTILLRLQKEIREYSLLLDETNDKEELRELKESIVNIKNKQDLVKEYKDMINTEEEEIIIDKDLKIFYTTTKANNVKLLSDIKKIPLEKLNEFNILFESIKSGRFKNAKKIGYSKIYSNPFMEVKLNQARMTYEILSDNIVVVTGAFVKKVQTSKRHNTTLFNNQRIYLSNKDYLLNNMDNEQFIATQEAITNEVSKILSKQK